MVKLKSRLSLTIAALSLSLFSLQPEAKAEIASSTSGTAVDVQNFHVAGDMYGFMSVDSGDINPHLKVNASLNFNYAWAPLAVVYKNTKPKVSAGELVAHRLDANIVAAIGFWNYVELAIDIPVILFQSGLSTPQVQIGVQSDSLQAVNFGDIRLTPKVRVVNLEDGRFSLAIAMNTILPTGNEKAFAGEAGVVLAPYLALSSTFDMVRFAVDLGYRWRAKSAKVLSLELDDEIFYKVGVGSNFGAEKA